MVLPTSNSLAAVVLPSLIHATANNYAFLAEALPFSVEPPHSGDVEMPLEQQQHRARLIDGDTPP